jgi:hypothetical protein
MTVTIPLPGLSAWLTKEARSEHGDVAVLAGHFALFSAGGMAVDLLDGATAPEGPAAEMLAFSRFTWRAACEAVASLAGAAPRLVVLADDIQFIRPVIGNKGVEEKLAAALAANYLEQTGTLPSFHLRVLAESGLDGKAVLAASADRWLFSERELRIAAVRHVRRELAEGRAADLEASEDGQTVTVTLPDHAGYCLVHSGRTTCAGGYLELLAALHARGIRKLIALVPMRCLGPIGVGTLLAGRLFPLPGLEVVNVAIPDPSLGLPASVFVDA